jgi:hypothetical protein
MSIHVFPLRTELEHSACPYCCALILPVYTNSDASIACVRPLSASSSHDLPIGVFIFAVYITQYIEVEDCVKISLGAY